MLQLTIWILRLFGTLASGKYFPGTAIRFIISENEYKGQEPNMTEREKLEQGLWYDANNDRELLDSCHSDRLMTETFSFWSPERIACGLQRRGRDGNLLETGGYPAHGKWYRELYFPQRLNWCSIHPEGQQLTERVSYEIIWRKANQHCRIWQRNAYTWIKNLQSLTWTGRW